MVGKSTLAHGMLMVIIALLMETIMRILDRRQTKHAVYAEEGDRGGRTLLHAAQ